MPTPLPTHFKRFGWLYAVSAVLILLPLFILHQYTRAYVKIDDFETAMPAIQRAFAAAHPELVTTHSLDLPTIDNKALHAASVDPLTIPQLAPRAEQLRPELARLDRKTSALTERLTLLLQRNVAWAGPPFLIPERVTTTSSQTANFLDFQTQAKVQRMLGERAAYDGQWDSALAHFYQSSAVGNLIRWHGLIGQLVAVATRAIGYGGYAKLLDTNAPPDVLRHALRDVRALEASAPAFTPWVMIVERYYGWVLSQVARQQQKTSMTQQLTYKAMIGYSMSSLSVTYALKGERMRTPRLRQRAARFGFKKNLNFIVGRNEMYRWTTLPAMARFLREVAGHEPELCRELQLEVPELASLNPLARVILLTNAIDPRFMEEAFTRACVVQTRGRLLAVALAARIRFDEQHAWPATIEALGANFARMTQPQPPPDAATSTPYFPLQMDWIAIDDEETSRLLWADRLPLKDLTQRAIAGTQPYAQIITARDLRVALADPSATTTLAIAEILEKNPWVTQFSIQNIDRALADRREPQITATLRAPSRALAIWSDGPDGKDDRARIAYDPTNGTTSRGDLIIFPERFAKVD